MTNQTTQQKPLNSWGIQAASLLLRQLDQNNLSLADAKMLARCGLMTDFIRINDTLQACRTRAAFSTVLNQALRDSRP